MATKAKDAALLAEFEAVRFGHSTNYEWVLVVQGVECRSGRLLESSAAAKADARRWIELVNKNGLKIGYEK